MPVDDSAFSAFRPTLPQAQLDFSLSALELAALLASRLCHDLISPIGAVNNAMELYDEGLGDEDALNLIRLSAANASARLQFARLADGAAGSAGDAIGSAEAEDLVRHYLGDAKTALSWRADIPYLPKDKARFLLNLAALAANSIPRGGKISVIIAAGEQPDRLRFLLRSAGVMLRLPAAFADIYSGRLQKEAISAHNIRFYWLMLLSRQNNMPLQISQQADFIEFLAE